MELDNEKRNDTYTAIDELPAPPSPVIDEDDCSLDRFMQSATKNNYTRVISGAPSVQLTDRMALVIRLSTTVKIWTQPHLTRMKVEEILKDYESGIFLIRQNKEKNSMVVSYKIPGGVHHLFIRFNLKQGFYLSNSYKHFANVNLLIANYMQPSLNRPTVCLKLPRALMEASEPEQFKYFEDMKMEFWSSLISLKSIEEIWPDSDEKDVSDNKPIKWHPPIPPRNNNNNINNNIQLLPPAKRISKTLNLSTEFATSRKENNPKTAISALDESYAKLWYARSMTLDKNRPKKKSRIEHIPKLNNLVAFDI